MDSSDPALLALLGCIERTKQRRLVFWLIGLERAKLTAWFGDWCLATRCASSERACLSSILHGWCGAARGRQRMALQHADDSRCIDGHSCLLRAYEVELSAVPPHHSQQAKESAQEPDAEGSSCVALQRSNEVPSLSGHSGHQAGTMQEHSGGQLAMVTAAPSDQQLVPHRWALLDLAVSRAVIRGGLMMHCMAEWVYFSRRCCAIVLRWEALVSFYLRWTSDDAGHSEDLHEVQGLCRVVESQLAKAKQSQPVPTRRSRDDEKLRLLQEKREEQLEVLGQKKESLMEALCAAEAELASADADAIRESRAFKRDAKVIGDMIKEEEHLRSELQEAEQRLAHRETLVQVGVSELESRQEEYAQGLAWSTSELAVCEHRFYGMEALLEGSFPQGLFGSGSRSTADPMTREGCSPDGTLEDLFHLRAESLPVGARTGMMNSYILEGAAAEHIDHRQTNRWGESDPTLSFSLVSQLQRRDERISLSPCSHFKGVARSFSTDCVSSRPCVMQSEEPPTRPTDGESRLTGGMQRSSSSTSVLHGHCGSAGMRFTAKQTSTFQSGGPGSNVSEKKPERRYSLPQGLERCLSPPQERTCRSPPPQLSPELKVQQRCRSPHQELPRSHERCWSPQHGLRGTPLAQASGSSSRNAPALRWSGPVVCSQAWPQPCSSSWAPQVKPAGTPLAAPGVRRMLTPDSTVPTLRWC